MAHTVRNIVWLGLHCCHSLCAVFRWHVGVKGCLVAHRSLGKVCVCVCVCVQREHTMCVCESDCTTECRWHGDSIWCGLEWCCHGAYPTLGLLCELELSVFPGPVHELVCPLRTFHSCLLPGKQLAPWATVSPYPYPSNDCVRLPKATVVKVVIA